MKKNVLKQKKCKAFCLSMAHLNPNHVTIQASILYSLYICPEDDVEL